MARAGIPEAAARLGVSVDTVRRRVRAGRLAASRDERGRYLVEIPEPRRPGPPIGEPSPTPAEEVLSELRRQRDQLSAQLADQQRHLEAHMAAEADLRRLLLALVAKLDRP
ncbi:MAG: helix-turn-helix domain-containing protein [Candidatus Dormibacterales bacterium]